MKRWIRQIQPSEYPPGVLEYMGDYLFNQALFPLRLALDAPIYPGKLPGAHVRHDMSDSRHSTQNKTRHSTATDSFVMNEHVAKLIRCADKISAIGGFGLYFDTLRAHERTMFHIDTRPGPQRIVWIRVDGEYIYQHLEPARYYTMLGDAMRGIGYA